MSQGDKWELFIKSELGYGDNQRGKHITPGAVLIFESRVACAYVYTCVCACMNFMSAFMLL